MNEFKLHRCIGCGGDLSSGVSMYSCSLRCEALAVSGTMYSPNPKVEELITWMLTKPKGSEITAGDLIHPNERIRKRAEEEYRRIHQMT